MLAPTLKVGSISIIAISDGRSSSSPANDLPSVSAEQWEPLQEYLNPDLTIPYNLGSFLIREGETWTLVDTGYGELPNTPGGELLSQLAQVSLHPDQITRVIVTHLHGDHVGGCTTNLDEAPTPVFKNARHIVQRLDWTVFHGPDLNDRPSVALCADPIEAAGLLDLIDGSQSLSAGISTLLTPGHTPGHQSILIASGDEKAIILGDVTHTPAQIIHPEWSPIFDLDPDKAATTRGALFDRIEQEGLTIAAGHYPHPCFGNIIRVEGKRRWHPLPDPRPLPS
jgi:glyoxylase-like metal-dependent hydrolase (beta-lactamase superfamily II)